MIDASVVMPLYRAEHIAWLALEGLARQKNVDFTWELIIAEEQNDETFGLRRIQKYYERLKKVGCVWIKYFKLDDWIPLGTKQHLMFQECHKRSIVVFFNAADLFSYPTRLKEQFDTLSNEKYDWYRCLKAPIYDLHSQKTLVHAPDISLRKYRGDSSWRAFKTDFARQIPLMSRLRLLDRQTFHRYCEVSNGNRKKIYLDRSESWRFGLNVNGLNNLSLNRNRKFKEENPPLYPASRFNYDMIDCLPEDIITKLHNCRKHLKGHKTGDLQCR